MERLTLVLGGAASGKSVFAEELATKSDRPCTYIATAQAFDSEMRAKILAHKERRNRNWETIEAPLEISEAIEDIAPERVLLIDCATLWLSNVMLEGRDVAEATGGFLSALKFTKAPTIVVSNETGMGVVPEYKLGRAFRAEQGMLNQRLAAVADRVVLVVAGLPTVLKGANQ